MKLEYLTPELLSKIPEYQEKCLEGVFDGQRYRDFDYKKAVAAVNHNYEICGYKQPLVIVAENPFEAQIFFNIIKILLGNDAKLDAKLNDKLYDKLYAKLRANLDDKLSSNLSSKLNAKLRAKLNAKLYDKLHDKLDDNLHDKLYDNLYDKLRDNLSSKLRANLDANLYDKNPDYLFTLSVYSNAHYTWYEFIRKEFNIELEPDFNDLFQNTFKLQRESGIYCAIFSEAICVVSKYPKKIYQQDVEPFELDNLDNASVIWGSLMPETEFDCYYISGQSLPKELFEKVSHGKFTLQDFAQIKNEEHRSTCINMMQRKFGESHVAGFFSEYLDVD